MGMGSTNGDFCVCHGNDDGTPMVMCDLCQNWYHFKCIDLTERDAEDIHQYVCNPCHQTTGESTILNWQTDAPLTFNPPTTTRRSARNPRGPQVAYDDPESSSDDGADSSGEFVDEDHQAGLSKNGRAARRISDSDDSRSPSPTGTRSTKTSTERTSLKRKASSLQSANKRKKAAAPRKQKAAHSEDEEEATLTDPVRKYCLGKLIEVIEPIYFEYRKDPEGADDVVKEAAARYVSRLEKALYDAYCEPDKNGKNSAAGKYKERFRMLTYNLDQKDRTKLRQRIAENTLAPTELAHMSSADLANEQTKQQIEAADEESLKHSILQARVSHPRAKITHKGEEIIEDMTGEEDRARARELEERERERSRAAALAGSRNPPQSPKDQKSLPSPLTLVQPISTTPMGSPTVTTLAMDTLALQSPSVLSPTRTPATPMASLDVRLNLSPTRSSFDLNTLWSGDIKNSDVISSTFVDEPESEPDGLGSSLDMGGAGMDVEFDETAADDQDFDMFLEKLDEEMPSVDVAPVSQAPTTMPEDGPALDAPAPIEPREPTPPPGVPLPDPELIAYQSLPSVWNGKIVMPDDPRPALSCPVVSRQISGKFNPGVAQWSILFPSNPVQIDGRVPTDKSVKYLVTTRLNPAKELLAVAFEPEDGKETEFKAMFDYLIAKNRHALIFPWGLTPPPTAPGKELYVVPLAASETVPEYIQLLDRVMLPSKRTTDILLGVFILQKGRITPPAPAPVPAAAPTTLPVSTLLQSIAAPIADAAAAPLVNMTPEQIQLIMQGLSKTYGAAPQPSFAPPQPQYPPAQSYSSYPPYSVPPNHGPPQNASPSSYGPGPSRGGGGGGGRGGRRDFSPPRGGRDGRGGRHRDDDRRGSGGGGRGRQRDNSGGGGGGEFGKPIDSGWAGRGRGRGGRGGRGSGHDDGHGHGHPPHHQQQQWGGPPDGPQQGGGGGGYGQYPPPGGWNAQPPQQPPAWPTSHPPPANSNWR